ncbi:hypothetical protein CLV24_107142 [Pontibacter ummariensis]|uniref:Uncharacterized protein n=1 Tax=Pontibacter ummariensis TaxID=1610492 RepID=A0A239ET23_9BACT|nr:hypothetical protein CLV24_107142 [Pontibacter ummariensis]SNS47561.1 hypothetical protein SAMN06296052_10746 [Pontibacter ummariensis]
MWIGLGATGALLVGLNGLNYVLGWHPLNLSQIPLQPVTVFCRDYKPYNWEIAFSDNVGYAANHFDHYFRNLQDWKRGRGCR